MKKVFYKFILLNLLILSVFISSFAQNNSNQIEDTIVKGDALIFNEDGYIYGR